MSPRYYEEAAAMINGPWKLHGSAGPVAQLVRARA